MDLVEIADRLYGVAPEGFVRERANAVATAKASGDAALARAVGALRKPSTSAGVLDAVIRQDPQAFADLFELGAQLRAAQDGLDGARLRTLAPRRREVLRAAMRTVVRLRAQDGQRLSDAVAREVEATLDAAIMDERAEAAVRSGRLVGALRASGFDPVDVDTAVALPDRLPPVRRAALRAVADAPAPSSATTDSPADRDRQRRTDEARERTATAERALVRATASLDSAAGRLENARAELADVEAQLAAAHRSVAQAQQAHTTATQDRDTARKERDAARIALRRLGER